MPRQLLLTAATLTAGTLVTGLCGCGGPPGDTLPSGAASVTATTSPEDVVRSYLGALQEGDGSAATSLTTGPYAERDLWASDPPTIEDVEVAAAEPRATTGTAAEGRASAVFVPVTFDLHVADETMPDGETSWGYLLVRDSDAEAWRIADAGSV